MAHIFKHKETNKLYTIEHLKVDMRFYGGAFTGIYAIPYNWKGKTIRHTLKDYRNGNINEFNPEKFVADNFNIVGEFYMKQINNACNSINSTKKKINNNINIFSFIEWKDNLHKTVRGNHIMYDIKGYYKYVYENELFEYWMFYYN